MKPDNTISTLLISKESNYVLFKVALDAAEEGLNVWFICTEPFEKWPENLGEPSKQILKLITFLYLKEYSDLIKHLNSTHKWLNIPFIIIVHSLEKYCDLSHPTYNRTKVAFLFAALLDSATYIGRRKQCKTSVLISCADSETTKLPIGDFQVYFDMYFDYVFLKSSFNSDEELLERVEHGFFLK